MEKNGLTVGQEKKTDEGPGSDQNESLTGLRIGGGGKAIGGEGEGKED